MITLTTSLGKKVTVKKLMTKGDKELMKNSKQTNQANHASVKFYRGSIRFGKWLVFSVLTLITIMIVLEFALAMITTVLGQNITVATAIIETSMLTAITGLLLTKWNVYQMWKRFFAFLFKRTAEIQLQHAENRAKAKAAAKTKAAKKTVTK